MLSSTTARIIPDLVPHHASGDFLQSKIVDYSIILQLLRAATGMHVDDGCGCTA
jgi:hypothetical protein